MFGIGLLGLISFAALHVVLDFHSGPIITATVVVYAAILLYDLWDLLRTEQHKGR